MSNAVVEELQNEIIGVFEQVTRYPREIIAPDVSLEEDLGIDSVKLGEIFAVLRERYYLPDKLDIARDRLRTIAGISQALHEYLAQQGAGSAGPAPRASAPPTAAAPAPTAPAAAAISAETIAALLGSEGPGSRELVPSRERVRERVLALFAEVTRYPREVLSFDANLEEDLGIDSVKLGEIFSVMREKYHLPEKLGIAPEELRTIGGLADALHRHVVAAMGSGHGAAPPRAVIERGHSDGNGHNGAAYHAGGNGHDGAAYHAGGNGHNGAAYHNGVNGHPAVASSFAALTPARKPFAGKVAFITGSGRGLGRDIALYLGELGASVIVNSFHSRAMGEQTAGEINAAGGDALHLWGSVANPAQLGPMFDRIEEHYGGLDFLISNASNGMLAPIEDLTVEHWEKAFRTNVVGLHQAAVRAARLMKPRGGGKIITLSSPAAHGYVEYFACMGAVKAAVESLTKALAIEFARYNIQVNCVSPGPIDGELLRKWPESARLVAEWTKATPYERLCEHRDVSHFVAYLLSEPVKIFTGSVLVLDGGISSRGW